jgi:hypothetical protein
MTSPTWLDTGQTSAGRPAKVMAAAADSTGVESGDAMSSQ